MKFKNTLRFEPNFIDYRNISVMLNKMQVEVVNFNKLGVAFGRAIRCKSSFRYAALWTLHFYP
jgi:hypothetical protein